MTPIREFIELAVWQKSRVLITKIYRITLPIIENKDFSFADQFRRAAISVSLNIAEGFERDNRKEFIYFLSISKGSCGELMSLLYISYDLQYITQVVFDELTVMVRDISRMLAGLIKYLKGTQINGLRTK